MAANVLVPLLIPLEENLRNTTRLLAASDSAIQFSAPRYCVVLPEDSPVSSSVVQVKASHEKGLEVKYRIAGGNRDGLFTIHQINGLITLAAKLDYELQSKHELVTSADSKNESALAVVQVSVADVNDNIPTFLGPIPTLHVEEEDRSPLPRTLMKVDAEDKDEIDKDNLMYSISGDGVDGYTYKNAYFTINPYTGELLQLRPLDRDPPEGKPTWKVTVEVRDGRPYEEYSINHNNEWEDVSTYSSLPKHRHYTRVRRRRETVHFRKEIKKAKFNISKGELKTKENLSLQMHSYLPLKGWTNLPFLHFKLSKEFRQDNNFFRMSSEMRNPKGNLSSSTTKCNKIQDKFASPNAGLTDTISRYGIHRAIKDSGKNSRKTLFLGTDERLSSIKNAQVRKNRYLSKHINKSITLEINKFSSISVSENFKSTEMHSGGRNPFSMSELTRRQLRKSKEEIKRVKLWKWPVNLKGRDKNRHLHGKDSYGSGEEKSRIFTRKRNLKSGERKILKKREADKGSLEYKKTKENKHILNKEDVLDAGGCVHYDPFRDSSSSAHEAQLKFFEKKKEVKRFPHTAQVTISIQVKDVNDHYPVFPHSLMMGEVQENGPIELSVATVSAWDADEGSNAELSYRIERNIVDRSTGSPLYQINPKTGLISTALCCLDRETTPEHSIVVSATDTGGLSASGTVLIRLVDVNDNSPRLTKKSWNITIDETFGKGPPDDKTILEVNVNDRDTTNYFFFRIVESSGWGWDYFGVRSAGAAGHIFPVKTLDYEDAAHTRGFHFMMQVTDKGRGGWDDSRHTDSAWISVQLRDINDNPPLFQRTNVHVTIAEDAAPGTLLTSFPAQDPDKDNQKVRYFLEDDMGTLIVDDVGSVRLWRQLDRESGNGDTVVAYIIAVDSGSPPLSSTATLTIHITDVNDCPPRLNPPTILHILEGRPSTLLGVLTATDDDLWARGHGPPFNFSVSSENPELVLRSLFLKIDKSMDSGRGGAELWTRGLLDREAAKELVFKILLKDNLGLSTTEEGSSQDAALGRVFVDDPDDWDIPDKTFSWLSDPHPLFDLDADTGDLYVSGDVREGRYELYFSVDDKFWDQKGVPANVTVDIRILPPDALAYAIPVTLSPISPVDLTKDWNPLNGGGGLGLFANSVLHALGSRAKSIEIVSLYGPPEVNSKDASSCIWLSAKNDVEEFMNPVKLQGLLAMKADQIAKEINFKVITDDQVYPSWSSSDNSSSNSFQFSRGASLPSTKLPLQVVDSNATSFVTPKLSNQVFCKIGDPAGSRGDGCALCLNGGKCVTIDGSRKCLCPGWTSGLSCKILSRSFMKNGWVWIQPLSRCLPLEISLRILTNHSSGIILHSGTFPQSKQFGMHASITLAVKNNYPQLTIFDEKKTSVEIELKFDVSDGRFHDIYCFINQKEALMMVDFCNSSNQTLDNYCSARRIWAPSKKFIQTVSAGPLQVGGLAHFNGQADSNYGGINEGFTGCISHLLINKEYRDIGEPAFSGGSTSHGCGTAECLSKCGQYSECDEFADSKKCVCLPGWTGTHCEESTQPISLSGLSEASIFWNFSSKKTVSEVQVRVRTKASEFHILQMTSTKTASIIMFYIDNGVFCAEFRHSSKGTRLCVNGVLINDGIWHNLKAAHRGRNFIAEVDDGDLWRRNESLPDLRKSLLSFDKPFDVKKVRVGTVENSSEESKFKGCIDDLRINGKHVPFSSAENRQVLSPQEFWSGCLPPNRCQNNTCDPPFVCQSGWHSDSCRCPIANSVPGPTICEDFNICLQEPCLFGGTCRTHFGTEFFCECSPQFIGKYCQWTKPVESANSGIIPILCVAISLSIFLFVLVISVVIYQTTKNKKKKKQKPKKQTFLKNKKDEICNFGLQNAPVIESIAQTTPETFLVSLQSTNEFPGLFVYDESLYHQNKAEIQVRAETLTIVPLDDFRAYAYEGEGSSSSTSWGSAMSGVKSDSFDDTSNSGLTPGFLEVIDLLKELPSPSVGTRNNKKRNKKS